MDRHAMFTMIVLPVVIKSLGNSFSSVLQHIFSKLAGIRGWYLSYWYPCYVEINYETINNKQGRYVSRETSENRRLMEAISNRCNNAKSFRCEINTSDDAPIKYCVDDNSTVDNIFVDVYDLEKGHGEAFVEVTQYRVLGPDMSTIKKFISDCKR